MLILYALINSSSRRDGNYLGKKNVSAQVLAVDMLHRKVH